jgi:hypothetical protein
MTITEKALADLLHGYITSLVPVAQDATIKTEMKKVAQPDGSTKVQMVPQKGDVYVPKELSNALSKGMAKALKEHLDPLLVDSGTPSADRVYREDDFNDSSIDAQWSQQALSGAIVEDSSKLNITHPALGNADWTVGAQNSPNVYQQIDYPGNFQAVVHCTLPSITDQQGGQLSVYLGGQKNYYHHIQFKRESGGYRLFAVSTAGTSSVGGGGSPSNPLVIGQDNVWLMLHRKGTWVSSHYSLNAVGSPPGPNDWVELAVDVDQDFMHPNNYLALSGFNFGALPAVNAEFRKWRVGITRNEVLDL